MHDRLLRLLRGSSPEDVSANLVARADLGPVRLEQRLPSF